MLGLSDAGAHASQLCDANFPTHLLSYWTREKGVLSLEQAVWRLTGQPADVYRLADRGRVGRGLRGRPGRLRPGHGRPARTQERVHDLPGGADRLIARSRGIEHVWVGGTAIRRDGEDLEAHPGQVIKPHA